MSSLYEDLTFPTPFGTVIATITDGTHVYLHADELPYRNRVFHLWGHVVLVNHVWNWYSNPPTLNRVGNFYPMPDTPPTFRTKILEGVLMAWRDYVGDHQTILYRAESKKLIRELESARAKVTKIKEELEQARHLVAQLALARGDQVSKCRDHWHCDPTLASHKCDAHDRSQPCPTCLCEPGSK